MTELHIIRFENNVVDIDAVRDAERDIVSSTHKLFTTFHLPVFQTTEKLCVSVFANNRYHGITH